ncbi:Ribosomal RNA-processing protein 8 [Cyphomyrmex costatus]|uniref:Ribosomal RNA-processing protein 8 n=1 Tax=Cyphomyrmex costatus TaxID=456900 RepID=A0A195CPS8_9HYME|nr:Ribosomal RNA-processing protein 8 [Cyphomyrmex costatus]
MAKLKKTLQDIQMPAVQSTKTSIVKKRRNRRKKKTNVELLNNIDKNNLKKSSVSNEIAKDTFTNMQNSEKKESYSFKNKLNTKYVKNIDVPTKYPKDNKNNLKKLNTSKNKLAKYTENSSASIKYLKSNKNNIKKLSVSNDKAKDVFPNWQKSKMKKSYDSKNKFDAKCTENSDILIKYPKHDKKRISNMSQEIQINSNVKVKCKKNKKRKQDMNLNRTNKNAVRVNDEDDENNEDNSSEDDKDKSFTKREEKLKKLQMELKNLKFKMTKLIEENKDNMKQMSTNVDAQQIRPNILKLNKHKININRLKEMLENKSQIKKVAQSTLRNKKDTLRDRMKIQLRASRFRFINETLYNNDSSQSKHYFQKEPDSFMAYHAGYKQQIEQWLINPLDVIISSIKELYIMP